jgi:hypothetical protein
MTTKYISILYSSLLRRSPVALACLALVSGCSSDDSSNNGAVTEATGNALGGSAGTSSGAGAGGTSNSSAAGAGGTSAEGMGGAVALGAGGSAQNESVGAGAAGASATATTDAGALDAGREDAGRGDAGNAEAVTYTKDIQPILVAQCSPCHSTLGNGGHNAASSYADAVRVSARMINEIRTGGMPDTGQGNAGCRGGAPGSPGCVSVADFALIQQWVADGTPQ